MKTSHKYIKLRLNSSGFTLLETLVAVCMISFLSTMIIPSSLNWIRTERVNAYTRELREYLRLVRLEARRWGASCFVNTLDISYNSVADNKDYYGYTVTCKNSSEASSSEATKGKGTVNTLPSGMFHSIPPICGFASKINHPK